MEIRLHQLVVGKDRCVRVKQFCIVLLRTLVSSSNLQRELLLRCAEGPEPVMLFIKVDRKRHQVRVGVQREDCCNEFSVS